MRVFLAMPFTRTSLWQFSDQLQDQFPDSCFEPTHLVELHDAHFMSRTVGVATYEYRNVPTDFTDAPLGVISGCLPFLPALRCGKTVGSPAGLPPGHCNQALPPSMPCVVNHAIQRTCTSSAQRLPFTSPD